MFRYVLFDLDGTLTDPADGITNSISYALGRRGIISPSKAELLKYIGPPLIPAFMDDFGMTESEAYETLMEYRVYFEKSGIYENSVYDGIKDLLSLLKSQGIVTAVATSKPEKYAREIITHFGLDTLLDFVGGSTMDEKRVHKDEVIAYCLEKLGVPDDMHDTVAMVGDRSYDIIGAKKCGICAIGVLYGYGSEGELTEAGADFIAETVSALGKVITEQP